MSEVLTAIREEMAAIKIPNAESAELGSSWQDLDMDSLELVELVKALEDRYGIVIADAELKSLSSVGDAVSAIEAKRAEGAAA